MDWESRCTPPIPGLSDPPLTKIWFLIGLVQSLAEAGRRRRSVARMRGRQREDIADIGRGGWGRGNWLDKLWIEGIGWDCSDEIGPNSMASLQEDTPAAVARRSGLLAEKEHTAAMALAAALGAHMCVSAHESVVGHANANACARGSGFGGGPRGRRVAVGIVGAVAK